MKTMQEYGFEYSTKEKLEHWIFRNQETVKVLEIALVVFGAGMIIAAGCASGGLALVLPLAIAGCSFLAGGVASFVIRKHFFSSPHDMKKHVFKEDRIDGGYLEYKGDLPVLTLETEDPFRMGYVQGRLCGESVEKIISIKDRFMSMLLQISDEKLEELKKSIPKKYILEMQGMLVGYNDWRASIPGDQSRKITLDDLIMVQFVPDFRNITKWNLHANTDEELSDSESYISSEARDICPLKQCVACSFAVAKRGEGNEIVRNLDWQTLGVLGKYGFIVHRKGEGNSLETVEVGIPGFIGTLSGVNSSGVFVSENELGYSQKPYYNLRGLPSGLFNRECLIESECVGDVVRYVRTKKPLVSYFLCAADKDKAIGVINEDNTRVYYGSTWSPLFIKNTRVPENFDHGRICEENKRLFSDCFRKIHVDYLRDAGCSLDNFRMAPDVNVSTTMQSMIYNPQTNTLGVAFDEGFAGDRDLQYLDLDEMFSFEESD